MLIDATGRALEIENEYKERARKKISGWNARRKNSATALKAVRKGVEELKSAALSQMENLRQALEELSAWSGGGLKKLEADMGLEPEITAMNWSAG